MMVITLPNLGSLDKIDIGNAQSMSAIVTKVLMHSFTQQVFMKRTTYGEYSSKQKRNFCLHGSYILVKET